MNPIPTEAPKQAPDLALLTNGDWQGYWRALLGSLAHNKIFAVDLDDTAWTDILVALNEAFGPIDTATGDKRWKLYDAAFKRGGAQIDGQFRTMTNAEHLIAEYQDLFAVKSLDQLVVWCKENIQLLPGFARFPDFLAANGIAIVAISNGARQLAHPTLEHHGLTIPLISNWFEDGKLRCLHEDGVDKGLLLRLAAQWGYQVIGCAGDSKGDQSMAEATRDLGGLVLARGAHGGLADWCSANVPTNQWLLVDNYDDVHHPLQQRIGGS